MPAIPVTFTGAVRLDVKSVKTIEFVPEIGAIVSPDVNVAVEPLNEPVIELLPAVIVSVPVPNGVVTTGIPPPPAKKAVVRALAAVTDEVADVTLMITAAAFAAAAAL
jgi:hypothetical protein